MREIELPKISAEITDLSMPRPIRWEHESGFITFYDGTKPIIKLTYDIETLSVFVKIFGAVSDNKVTYQMCEQMRDVMRDLKLGLEGKEC